MDVLQITLWLSSASSVQLNVAFSDHHFPPEQEVVLCLVAYTHSEVTLGQLSMFSFLHLSASDSSLCLCEYLPVQDEVLHPPSNPISITNLNQ